MDLIDLLKFILNLIIQHDIKNMYVAKALATTLMMMQ